MPTLRTQTGMRRSRACFTESGLPTIGGILQNAPYRRAIPPVLAARTGNALFIQAPAHCSDGRTLAPHPIEYFSDYLRVLFDNFITRAAGSFEHVHIAITIGSAGQDADLTALCLVPLAAPAAFQDLGALIFGHHSLHLQ